MLVLSRHASETIRIGDDIVVSVQRISGNRVIIGIDAPQEVAIRRGELAFEGDGATRASDDRAASKGQPASQARPALQARPARAAASKARSSSGSAAGSGLAARRRPQDRRPVAVPLTDSATEWSASHIS
ncbi:carbon storage regulator [Candidatus Laterigemmans baculatus]|uniref:carbon storage regulator n=1 Tax=Candidatus Laterigemmans baculatus TaxID=2770505 RepID=UPI0013D93508|nr:carbon storage regulator [Candidatus Laterigemmans baculatus]